MIQPYPLCGEEAPMPRSGLGTKILIMLSQRHWGSIPSLNSPSQWSGSPASKQQQQPPPPPPPLPHHTLPPSRLPLLLPLLLPHHQHGTPVSAAGPRGMRSSTASTLTGSSTRSRSRARAKISLRKSAARRTLILARSVLGVG